ncbi:MAG: ATP-binding protein [Candidatus Omnitrophica bacterium]|nr:ATP-binding protein [Candidatus Omnitrophota bacterium]
MKTLLVISGKGGTGKTVLTGSLAVLVKNKVMVDCDVDAADLHLLLHPDIKERHEFKGGQTAVIDKSLCKQCGRCMSVCRFGAIKPDFVVEPFSCEGCGLCHELCPRGAIRMKENIAGEWFVSQTRYGPFVHAKLGVAEENSGKLVAKIRQVAKELAERNGCDYVIIDGPPGIGCPVIASLSGVDLAIIVTEPTVSGLHDLKRVWETAHQFKVRTQVVINKYDLNLEYTSKVRNFCAQNSVDAVGEIPFSHDITKAVVQGVPPVAFCSNGTTDAIKAIWSRIERSLGHP